MENKNENNNHISEDNTNTEQQKKKPSKKGFFDINLSYLVIFLTLGVVVALVLIFDKVIYPLLDNGNLKANSIALNVVCLIFGLAFGCIFYTLGKILFAVLIGKYEIQMIEFFGLKFTKINKKMTFSFKFGEIMDFHLRFKPKSLESNPIHQLYGGHIVNLIVMTALIVGGYFLSQSTLVNRVGKLSGVGMMFSGMLMFAINFYELLPFRSDYDNDMYTFINTRKKENREAYNLLLINEANEVNYIDFVVPTFSDYNSYYKTQTLYYKYCQELYENNFDEAINTLNTIQYYSKYLPLDMLYTINGEKVYIYLLNGDEQSATRIFLSLKKDNKKFLLETNTFNNYRIAVLIAGVIANSEADVHEIIEKFNSLTLDTSSLRVRKEIEFFNNAVEMVYNTRTDFTKNS